MDAEIPELVRDDGRMGKDNAKVVSDGERGLLEELENLLEKQMELARQGDIGGVERLSTRADFLVREIVRAGILQLPELECRRGRFERLYGDMRLVLASHRAETAESLKRVRQVKKVLDVYRKSI